MGRSTDTTTSYRDLLESQGYAVCCAESGEEALQQAAAFRPDVVILDLGLPRMSGLDVTRRLRQSSKQLPTIIIVSGFATVEDRRRAREAGCDYFLAKPADCEELICLLARCPRVDQP